MKKIIYLISLMIWSEMLSAQIAGLSASKLATLCTTPVVSKTIEIEPFFSLNNTPSLWNDVHEVELATGIKNSSFFGFRFTYGLTKNIESGFSLPADASSLQWGIKYRLINKDVFSFALISGINMDSHTDTLVSELGLGGVFTLQYSKNISTDIDFHLIDNVYQNNILNQFIVGMDNGIYIGDIQYILGINYFHRLLADNAISNNLYLSPGVTIEPANHFLMVIALPISVYGTNDVKDIGFSFALTITID